MREYLTQGSHIQLKEIGTEKTFDFEIQEVIGMGASCIVYTAVYTDAEKNQFTIRLKECFPEGLNIFRKNDVLVISEESEEKFEKHITHFTEGYKRQIALRSIPENQNSISNIQGIFEGNNTKYIAMTCQNGIRLDRAELSVYDVFRVLKAVTLQIQNFHNKGWLYLDLKPENVILYPETPELVMLFDFDSTVQVGNVQPEYISFTKSWSAPEVLQRKIQNIGICSDVYAVGALLLFLIFGRSPALSDRTKRASWNFENSILSDESPELKRMATDLLKHTLCADVKNRYDSCQQILDVIEPFIESFQKQKPYLKTVLPMNSNYFCGRDREIAEIHKYLQQTNFLVLHGIGGIGKSELAKHYAMNFSSEYDAVVFVRYQNSVLETVANDSLFPIVNLNRENDESDENYFIRKMKILQKICTPRHLIILDNFDTDECENLDELLSLNCKFLLTSRVDFEDIFPQYEVDVLDDFESLRAIFSRYSKQETDTYADNIIIALEGHTMAVELVSKQMKLNDISTEMMYQKLCEKGIYADDNKIKNIKDGSLRNKTAYAHMEILFSIFDLNDEEKQVLRYVALIGSTPITVELFKGICKLTEKETESFERLIRSGWIQASVLNDFDIITPHTLIVDVLANQLKPDVAECTEMIVSCTAIATGIDVMSEADERKFYIQFLDHTAHTISGISEELAEFYDWMTIAVYMRENMFKKALWAVNKEFEILEHIEGSEEKIMDALIHGRDASRSLGNETEFQKFDELLKSYETTDEYRFKILDEEMMDFMLAFDYDSAKTKVEEMIALAETMQDDRKIASAYGDMLLIQNTFQIDENKKEYAEKALFHLKKYFSKHFNDFDEDSEHLAWLYYELAEAYRNNGNYDDAIENFYLYAETMQKAKEGDYSFWITAYTEIGDCYQKMQDYDKLAEYYEKAFEYSERFYGEKHIETGKQLMYYSNALIELYNSTKNIKILEHCKEIMEKAIDISLISEETDNNLLNNFYIRYSTVLSCLGYFEESHRYAKTALDFFSSVSDRSDHMTARIYLTMGDNFLNEKDKENAEKYYHLAVQIYKENGWGAEKLEELLQDILDKI